MGLFYYCHHIDEDTALFDPHETGHLKVMKKKEGDEISFTDGKGHVFQGVITTLKKSEAVITIVKKTEDFTREIASHVEITAGLSRWNRLSILIEKAVELGVKCINIVNCERSNYQKLNLEKVERTARKALKQCGGTLMPDILLLDSPEKAHKEGIVPVLLNPYASKSIKTVDFPSKTNVFIGPEGGFTKKELERIRALSVKPIEITLGKRILRLETAAIVAIAHITLS